MYGFGETITIVSLTYMVVVRRVRLAVPYCPANAGHHRKITRNFSE